MSPPRATALRPPETTSPTAEAEAGVDAGRESFPGELAGIAAEVSVYPEPRWGSKRIGYLRAGAVVRRGPEPVATGPRCPEGWYAVEPRGYVCVGAMATLDI